MKKIINGKMYNTETAKFIGCANATVNSDYSVEYLYQKKTGEFFLVGRGNRCSHIGEDGEFYVNTSMDSDEASNHDFKYNLGKFLPITEELAKRWVETFCFVEEYEALFGVVEE